MSRGPAGKRGLGRLNVYRHALASWYGPGLYGNRLGCGGRLGTSQLGVAHKSLPCGTKVTLRHRGRVVRVPVIDRGPYVGAREYDLTAATARRAEVQGPRHDPQHPLRGPSGLGGVACSACSGVWRISTWTPSTWASS